MAARSGDGVFQDFMRKELVEASLGQRIQKSRELSRMILDSLDWDQPCLPAFNKVWGLLRKHQKILEK